MTTRWVEVNLDNLQHNIKEVKERVGPVKVLAVVKADAYGHGAVSVAKTVMAHGADYLGVSNLEEALELRQAGISAPILVMSLTLPDQLSDTIRHDITVTCSSVKMALALQQKAQEQDKSVKVHINIDVGMQRYGIEPEHAVALAQVVTEQPLLELEGVYTHFPKAEDSSLTRRQLAQFLSTVGDIESAGIKIPIRHCANSTAMASLEDTWLDMVRVGTLLIGQCRVPTNLNLRPTWHLKARIVSIKRIPKGTALGYGLTYKVKRDSTIAIVPLGFADGISMWPVHRSATFMALLKSLAKDILRFFGSDRVIEKAMLADGTMVPYVGKVGMQHVALDVTHANNVEVGDEVALRAVQANINALLPKVYYKEGKINHMELVSQ